MITTIGLASIFGPLLVILGIWGLMYQENLKKIREAFKKQPPSLFMAGYINLLVGLTIIHISPEWVADISVLVTLLGWLLLLKGLMVLFFPKALMELYSKQSHIFLGLVSVVWGLALCWLAFMQA